jgi:hypothetical protein
MHNTKLTEQDTDGRYLHYDDTIGYTQHQHKIAQATKHDLPAMLEEEGLIELLPKLQAWADEEIRLGMCEFINRFLAKMSQNLHGFCLLRALGYDVMLEHEGKSIKSLRQMAEHFQVHHSYIHKLTKDLQTQIGLGKPKDYSTKVKPPKGYMTISQAMTHFGIDRLKLWEAIKRSGAKVKPYKMNSKLVQYSVIAQFLAKKA